MRSQLAADAVRLDRLRYQGGSTSYLEVLTNDATLYTAQVEPGKCTTAGSSLTCQLYSFTGWWLGAIVVTTRLH